MKFQIEDTIVNNYTSAFEVIKDKVRTKLHELNKAEIIDNIKEQPHKTQYLTDGVTLTIESTPSNELTTITDNSIAATITIDFKNEKEKKPEIYKIIKNPKKDK